MKRYAISLIASACMLFLLACPPASAAARGEEEPLCVLKMANPMSLGYGWLERFREIIIPGLERDSRGEIKIKVYWSGIMLSEEDYLHKVLAGQLQMAGFGGLGSALACPEFSVVELPFLFSDYGEVNYVRERMFDSFDHYFGLNKLKLAFWLDEGFDRAYSAKMPLAGPAEFREARFMGWYGPVEEALFRALGARSLVLPPPEIPSAWRSGLVDAIISPSLFIVGAQLYKDIGYINPTRIRYSPVAVVVGLEAWNNMPETCRRSFSRVRSAATEACNEGSRQDNQKCIDAMIKYGIKEAEMSPEALEQMKKELLPVYGELSGVAYPAGLLEELLRHLREFRAGRARVAGKKPYPTPEVDFHDWEKAGGKAAWQERAAQIRAAQEKLGEQGYFRSAPDGIGGPETFNAVYNFRWERGFPLGGAVDAELLRALGLRSENK